MFTPRIKQAHAYTVRSEGATYHFKRRVIQKSLNEAWVYTNT